MGGQAVEGAEDSQSHKAQTRSETQPDGGVDPLSKLTPWASVTKSVSQLGCRAHRKSRTTDS